MWMQLIEANHLDKTGSSIVQEPASALVERERQHAERLAHLTRLRAARLAHTRSMERVHA
jgi:hypothetical protein